MKKILLYLFLIILSTFLIPILFTIQFSTANVDVGGSLTANVEETPTVESTIAPQNEPYNYKEYGNY